MRAICSGPVGESRRRRPSGSGLDRRPCRRIARIRRSEPGPPHHRFGQVEGVSKPKLRRVEKSLPRDRRLAPVRPSAPGHERGVLARSRISVTPPGRAAAPRPGRGAHSATGHRAPRRRRCSYHKMYAEQESSLDNPGNAGGGPGIWNAHAQLSNLL